MLDEYNEMNPKPQNIAKLGAAVDMDQSDQTTCKSVWAFADDVISDI